MHYKTDAFSYNSPGFRARTYVSIDHFYCEKCAETKEVKKEETYSQPDFTELPDWAKAITEHKDNYVSNW